MIYVFDYLLVTRNSEDLKKIEVKCEVKCEVKKNAHNNIIISTLMNKREN